MPHQRDFEDLVLAGAPGVGRAPPRDVADILTTGPSGALPRRGPLAQYLEAGGDLERLEGVMRFGSRANRNAVPIVWRRNFQGGTTDALRSIGPGERRRLYDQFKVSPRRRDDIEQFLRGPRPAALPFRGAVSDGDFRRPTGIASRLGLGAAGEIVEQFGRRTLTTLGVPGVEPGAPVTGPQVFGEIASGVLAPTEEIGGIEAALLIASAPGSGLIFNLSRAAVGVDVAQVLRAGRGGLRGIETTLRTAQTGARATRRTAGQLLREEGGFARVAKKGPPLPQPGTPRVTTPTTTTQAGRRARGEGGLRESTSPAGPSPQEVREMSVRARLRATQANDEVNTIATGARDKRPPPQIPTEARRFGPVRDVMPPRPVVTEVVESRVPGLPRQVAGTRDLSLPSGVYRGGTPPGKAGGGSVRPPRDTPRFTKAIETLLAHGRDTGIDSVLIERATEAARLPVPIKGAISRFWNPLRGLVSPAANRNPDLQLAYKATQNYVAAQTERATANITGLTGAIEQAFGRGALNGSKVATELYIGRELTGKAVDDLVGTVFHVLENSQSYQLNPLQRRVVKEWGDILNFERQFSEDVGVKIGIVEDVWVSHSFVNPEKAAKTLTSKGKPGFMRERNLTLDEFAEFAQRNDLAIQTDLETILANRLFGAANVRANLVFAEELAERVGARAVTEGGAAVVGRSNVVTAGGKQWVFPKAIADDLIRLQSPEKIEAAESLVMQGIDTMRAALLNLDFSIGFGRQGFLAFMNDPIAAIKGWASATAIVTSKEGWATWYATNARRAEAWAQAGLQLRGGPYSIKLARVGEQATIVEKIPGLGWLSRFQGETIMPVLKLNSADSSLATLQAVRDGKGLQGVIRKIPFFDDIMKKVNGNLVGRTDEELMQIVADAQNNWLGGINWADVGRRPGIISKALILTEGWTRAQIGTFINAAKMTPEGVLARQLLIRELKMATFISTAISLTTTGKLPEYDPRSARFLDVLTPFGRVGIMPHKTIMRTIVRGMVGKPSDEFGPDSLIRQRVDAVYGFFEGRLGQVPRMTSDMIRGEDFFGRKIESKWKFTLEQMLPIIGQQLWDDIRAGESFGDTAGRAAAEFAGWNTRPFSVNDQKSDLITSMNIDAAGNIVSPNSPARVTNFSKLDPATKGALNQTLPFREIEDRGGPKTTGQALRELRQTKIDDQVARDTALLSGDMSADNWRNALYDEQKAAAGGREVQELLEGFAEREPTEPNDIALNDYYDISGVFTKDGVFDAVGRREAIDDYLGSLPNEQRDFVLKNIHPNVTPLARRYYDMLQSRRDLGWYDLHTQITDRNGVNKWNVLSKPQQDTYLAMRDATTRGGTDGRKRYVAESIPAEARAQARTIFNNINREVRAARLVLRERNPGLDIDHVLFYNTGPVTREAQAAMAKLSRGKNELQWLIQRKGVKMGPDILDRLAVSSIETFAQLDATSIDVLVDLGITLAWATYIKNQARGVAQRQEAA